MTGKIKHRRLNAFFRCKVLNALMLVVIVSLLLMAYLKAMVLPVVCGTVAFLFFIGYSLWFWVKKPQRVTINYRLSDINGCYTLYFLVISAVDNANEWWYITPVALSVVVLFAMLISNTDKTIDL